MQAFYMLEFLRPFQHMMDLQNKKLAFITLTFNQTSNKADLINLMHVPH